MLHTVYDIPYTKFEVLRILKPSFEPLRANLGQQVYQHLRDKIFSMEIEPGTSLGVGEIAAQLGVSRSPVRDALLMLVSEGIVELLPNGGYGVIQFDRKYIDDAFVLRRALEVTAVRLCVENLERERVQALRDTWEKFRLADVSDPQLRERHVSADQHLHQSLTEMCGNAMLKDVLDKVISITGLIRMWYYTASVPNSQLIMTAEEHLKFLDAMLAHNADGAAAAMEDHVRNAHARTLARLDMAEAGTMPH